MYSVGNVGVYSNAQASINEYTHVMIIIITLIDYLFIFKKKISIYNKICKICLVQLALALTY